MASFNFTVDTEPMASTIHGVSRHVDGVTTAVIAMQTAVVIAEKNASDNISYNVNRGFYTLIRSQISQKIAKYRSQVDSKQMEMTQQSASLASIKNQMERDYEMICKRYTKLFNSLNKSLKTRIFELDKPTMGFITNQVEPAANRLRIFLGKVPIQQTECVGTSQVIASTNTKVNAFKTIMAIKGFIGESRLQKSLIGLILSNRSNEGLGECHIPVIIVESRGLGVQQNFLNYLIPAPDETSLNARLNKSIQHGVVSNMSSLSWYSVTKEDKDRVSSELRAMVETSGLPPRIKEKLLLLHENSNWLTLKKQSNELYPKL